MNLLKYVYIITGSAESSAFIWVNEFILHLQYCSNQPHFKPALQAIALGRSETQNEFDVTPLKKDNLSNNLRRIFQVRKSRCAWEGSRAIGLVEGFDADQVFCMYLWIHVACPHYPFPLVPAKKVITQKHKET
jgi:hypothetical protein